MEAALDQAGDGSPAATSGAEPTMLDLRLSGERRPGFATVSLLDEQDVPSAVRRALAGLRRDHYELIHLDEMLQCFTHREAVRLFLDCAELLSATGKLSIDLPSPVAVAYHVQHAAEVQTQADWLQRLHGPARQGAPFRSAYSEALLRVLLITAGFSVETLGVAGGWRLSATAYRAFDWRAPAGEPDDGAFLNAVYRAALDREADAAGRTHFIDRLSRREMSRRDVLLDLYTSDERFGRMARLYGSRSIF